MTDSRSVAQNVPNEPGNFCHTTEKKRRSYQKLQESRPKERGAKLTRFQWAQNGTTEHQRGQLPQ